MCKNKIKNLRSYDIIFITLIMFGVAIKGSTIGYLELLNGTSAVEENITFKTSK